MGDYRSYLIDPKACDQEECQCSSESHRLSLHHTERAAEQELLELLDRKCNNIKVYELYNLKPIKWQPKDRVQTIEFLDRDDDAKFVGEKV